MDDRKSIGKKGTESRDTSIDRLSEGANRYADMQSKQNVYNW